MSTTKLTVVLVHGAWHGSWCWKFQIPALEALGYDVETVDLPCVSGEAGPTQFDDAAHVRSVVESLVNAGKRVVVVPHSYAGPIASAAIAGLPTSSVLGLVDLTAYIEPGGLDQGAYIQSIGGMPYATFDTPSKGLHVHNNPRAMLFEPDVPADRIDWAIQRLVPQSMAGMLGIVPPQVWQEEGRDRLLGYIRCTADGTIPIEFQDSMIESAGGRERWIVRTLEGASHSPFLSRPEDVAAAFDEIIKEFEATSR